MSNDQLFDKVRTLPARQAIEWRLSAADFVNRYLSIAISATDQV